MIQITNTISIDEREIKLEFIKSSGPGGQNINKVATAVKLKFDVVHSPSLPDDVRQRLLSLYRKRINKAGILIIDARRYRTQEQNRQDAVDRLVELIRKASKKPKPRKKTAPPYTAKIERLKAKRQRSEIKRLRSRILYLDE